MCVMIYEYEHDEQRSDDTKISIVSNTAVPPIATLIILLRRRSTAVDLPPHLIWTSSVSSLCYVCVDHISLSSLSLHPSN